MRKKKETKPKTFRLQYKDAVVSKGTFTMYRGMEDGQFVIDLRLNGIKKEDDE